MNENDNQNGAAMHELKGSYPSASGGVSGQMGCANDFGQTGRGNGPLEKENARLQQELARERLLRGIDQDYGLMAQKRLDVASERLHHAENYIEQLGKQNAALAQTNRISAEGLMIEHNELLNRAARLAMRIRGLGFEVE